MVRSKLDPDIVYPDKLSLDKDDEGKDLVMYEGTVKGIDVTIALGRERYTYIAKNVVYFPFYLVKDGEAAGQLGVYEILSSSLPGVLDREGDVDIGRLYEPLLYASTTQELLRTAETSDHDVAGPGTVDADVTDVEAADDLDAESDVEPRDLGDVSPKEGTLNEDQGGEDRIYSSVTYLQQPELQAEDKNIAREIENRYTDHKGKLWIQRYMKNGYYNIVPGTKDSNCLFDVLAAALRQIGKNTNPDLLRKRVAEAATPAVFEYYKMIYDTALSNLSEDAAALKSLKKTHDTLKERLSATTAHSVQLDIVGEAKIVQAQHVGKKAQHAASKSMLSEYAYMEKISNAKEFQETLTTCGFWADTWAMSVLEKALNLKTIVLNQSAFDAGDMHNVLECGAGLHAEIAENVPVDPSHYVILSHRGPNYELITYRERGIFTYNELPYTLRAMIASRCLEQEDSPFRKIVQFDELRADMGLGDNDIDGSAVQAGGADCERNIVFVISPFARGDVPPGHWAGEEIPVAYSHDFAPLGMEKDWRNYLSDTYMSPITLSGKTWPSVVHYYEGSKFRKENPEFASLFAQESKSDISKDPDLAEAVGAGRSSYKGRDINTEGVKVDRDMFRSDGKGRHLREYEAALEARARQDPRFKAILMKTNRAKLVSHRPGQPPRTEVALMKLRSSLQ